MHRLPRLTLLGLVTGLLAGLVIILFRDLTELAQVELLGLTHADGYKEMSGLSRLGLATLGGLAIGITFRFLGTSQQVVGVVHVIERLHFHQGRLPWRNAVVQFLGAGASIFSGHSVGREGPGIHLGATPGSLLGGYFGLTSNEVRTLVACGAAASIAAGFDTPLAGVIFVMEVVMMEYTVQRFTPVIIAAVSAALLNRAWTGNVFSIDFQQRYAGTLPEMGGYLLLGLAVGLLAALFIHLLLFISRHTSQWPVTLRFTLAGLACGVLAWPTPQIMGIGYDTIDSIIGGDLDAIHLASLAGMKLLATACAIGLGLPGGLIGPTLVIGAAAGGVAGLLSQNLLDGTGMTAGFHAVIGMVAMMGATLQAPLAALMALLELTANPAIILPGMIAVITANLTTSQLFRHESVFVMLMRARGLDPLHTPLARALQQTPVSAAIDASIAISEPRVTGLQLRTIIQAQPRHVVLKQDDGRAVLLPLNDLANWLAEQPELADDADIDLGEIPAQRHDLRTIRDDASYYDAIEKMDEQGIDALLVIDHLRARGNIIGVVTRHTIRDSQYVTGN